MKGTLTTTCFGTTVLESVLGSDGNLYVPSRTISSIFSTPQKHLSRELKALLGEGCSTPQIELDNEKHENLPTRLTCIPLSAFGKVLRHYDRKGNAAAQEIAETSADMGLTQMLMDSHGVKFEKAERQSWLELRAESKVTRRSLTDAAKDWYVMQYGVEPAGPYYSDLTDRMYLMLFGKRAAVLRKEYPGKGLLRDYLPKDMLHKVEATETVLVNKIDRGRNPHTAIQDLA